MATKMTSPVQSAGVKRRRNRGGRGLASATSVMGTVPAEKKFSLTGWAGLSAEERSQKAREYFSWATTKGLFAGMD